MITARNKTPGPGTYNLVWPRDPAIRPVEVPEPPDADAGEEAVIAHEAAVVAANAERTEALRVARETQDWTPLLLPGEKPTLFVMRWLPAMVRGIWNDRLRQLGGTMGYEEGIALLFLLALTGVENFGGRKFKPEESDVFGDTMMPAAFLDELKRIVGPRDFRHLVSTVGGQVFDQEASTGPL